MLTVEQVAERAAATEMVTITEAERDEFARALVLQGYMPDRAHRMAFETIADNDGALQMLARHRIHSVDAIKGAAINLLGAFGGDVPDWLRIEYDALMKALDSTSAAGTPEVAQVAEQTNDADVERVARAIAKGKGYDPDEHPIDLYGKREELPWWRVFEDEAKVAVSVLLGDAA